MDDDDKEDVIDWIVIVAALLASAVMFSLAVLFNLVILMDDTTLAIMEALAAKIEALAARVEAAEKKLAEQCSCQAWGTLLRPDAGDAQSSDIAFLTQREAHMLIEGVGE